MMNTQLRTSAIVLAALGAALAFGSTGCGASTTTRMVDDPTGTGTAYGAPKDTKYSAELGANKQRTRITVYETSRCDVIPVTVMQSYQETLSGDEIIQRAPVSKKQVSGAPQSTVACNQTYARNVEVLLEIEGSRVSLGQTDAEGMVYADLATLLETGTYEVTPTVAKVFLRADKARPSVPGGEIQLSQLAAQEARVQELIARLSAILAKGETGQSADEITESYKIYGQLQEVAGSDPRVEALGARFWELFHGRKQEESREKLSRNLDALGEAQELLKVMGDAAIPLYVQVAVSSGQLDRRALEWSSLRLVSALRGAPDICSVGFSFSAVPSYGWGPDAALAARYVQFGYGNSHAASVQGYCRGL